MTTTSNKRLCLLLTLGALALLYLLTLYPGPGGRLNFGDSAKFQYVGRVLGVPHEPGFPQYVVLNHLWTALPLPGSLAVRVNLLSIVFALVAAGLFFGLARHLSGDGRAAALATLAVFLGRTTWAAATEAEVYSLNLAWVAGVVWLGHCWRESRRPAALAGMLFAYGLSFGVHPSMIVLLPALTWLIVTTEPRQVLQPRWIGTAVAAAALGLSQYAYVLWRARAEAPYLETIRAGAGIADLPPFLFAARFSDRFFMAGVEGLLFSGLGRVVGQAHVELLLPALLFAGAGAAVLWRRDRKSTEFIALGALSYALFAASYEIPDWEVYCLPIWLFLGWLIAVSLGETLRAAPSRRRLLLSSFVLPLAAVVLFNGRLLRLEQIELPHPTLVEAAGADAILVTHAEQADYHSAQLDNYYRLGMGLGARRGLRFAAAEEVFYTGSLYLSDTPLFVADPISLQYFVDAGADVVADSPNGDLAGWIEALPPRTLVAVAINEIGTANIRGELAAALRPLGLGESLPSAAGVYVGLGAKGPGTGIEVANGDTATLRIEPGDARWARMSGASGPPASIEVRAAASGGRRLTSLQTSGRLDADARRGLRIFLFTDSGFESRHVDSAHGTAFAPMYWSTATRSPIRSLTIEPRPGLPPGVSRDDGTPITRGSTTLEATVVGCRERRVKGIRTFEDVVSPRGLDALVEFVPQVLPGDWLVISARGPVPAAARPALRRTLRSLGAVDVDLETVRSGLAVAGRIGAPPPLVLVDPEVRATIEITCASADSPELVAGGAFPGRAAPR